MNTSQPYSASNAFEPGSGVRDTPWTLTYSASTRQGFAGIKVPQSSKNVSGTAPVPSAPFAFACKTATFEGNNRFIATAFTESGTAAQLVQGGSTTGGDPWVRYTVNLRGESTAPPVEQNNRRPARDSLLDPDEDEDAVVVQRRAQAPQGGPSGISQQEQNENKANLHLQQTGQRIALPRPGNQAAQEYFDQQVVAARQRSGGVPFPPSDAGPANPGQSSQQNAASRTWRTGGYFPAPNKVVGAGRRFV